MSLGSESVVIEHSSCLYSSPLFVTFVTDKGMNEVLPSYADKSPYSKTRYTITSRNRFSSGYM